jgi:lysophospholipase L1-like esterase
MPRIRPGTAVAALVLGAGWAVITSTCAHPRGDPASLAALGDSLTARYRLAFSYPDLLGRWRGIPVRNFGVSGDTTAQMLDRLEDVLGSGPTPQVVVILGGTNDVARGMPVEAALRNLQAIAERVRDSGRRPVLVCPPPSGSLRLERAEALRTGLRDYARAQGFTFVDPWPAMEDPGRHGWPRPELALDVLHPNERGQYVLAEQIARALGWPVPPPG